jgi:SUKH-4 immunity protein
VSDVVTRAELLEGWPAEEIVTVAPELLASSDVPDQGRRFLAEVGLPRAFPYYFTTVADHYQDPAVDVADGQSLIGVYWWRDTELLRLGSNYGQYVCVEAGRGEVVQVPQEASDERTPSFVNSSVDAFAAFLLRVRLRQLAGGLDELSDEELEARSQVFLGALRELDPAALADEEGYWSVVVEQMGYGHL